MADCWYFRLPRTAKHTLPADHAPRSLLELRARTRTPLLPPLSTPATQANLELIVLPQYYQQHYILYVCNSPPN